MLLNILNTFILIAFTGSNYFGFLDNLADVNLAVNESSPARINNESLGIKTTAKSFLVFEEASKNILLEKNAGEKIPIASLTKFMTVLVFLEYNPGWDKKIKILPLDKREGGIIYLWPNETVTVRDLFNLTLVASANEAAAALARSTGLTDEEFIKKMNQKAGELQMKDTVFADPTGLDVNNVSTAKDLIFLASEAFADENILAATIKKDYLFFAGKTKRMAKNTNLLLSSFLNQENFSITGAKTGYLEESGYNQIMRVINKGNDKSIVIIILGSATAQDKWQEIKTAVFWVFKNFSW